MLGLAKLRNPVRTYAWGSRTAIANLQGRPVPSPEAEAELWMGAHPQASSEVRVDGTWRSLWDVVRESPDEVLGPAAAGGGMPFLFKVLAADEPLSIQAHPDAEQARQGFEREEAAGIARDAAHRNYRDPHPKPEILYALTPFAMVRGFRRPREIHSLLTRLGLAALWPEAAELRSDDEQRALERFFSAWMTSGSGPVATVLEAAVAACAARSGEDPACRWVRDLAERYPGDRGALAPVFLNVAELAPGEAVFTGPGVLHAYLGGVGVELMTSSDNVLRGGLTAKHVDVPELLEILRFEPLPIEPLTPVEIPSGQRFEAGGLRLDVVAIPAGGEVRVGGARPAVLFCVDGSGTVAAAGVVRFARGDSFLVPASVGDLRIAGSATLFLASAA